MSSSFWLLGIESRNFSFAEKERTANKDEHIHKVTTTFTQNGLSLSENSCRFVNLHSFRSSFFLSHLEKNYVILLPIAKNYNICRAPKASVAPSTTERDSFFAP